MDVIYKDYLVIKLREFRNYYDDNLKVELKNAPKTEEELRKELEEEANLIINQRLNYADNKFYEEYEEDKKQLRDASKSFHSLRDMDKKRLGELFNAESHINELAKTKKVKIGRQGRKNTDGPGGGHPERKES